MEEVETIIQQLRDVLMKQLERIDRPIGEMVLIIIFIAKSC